MNNKVDPNQSRFQIGYIVEISGKPVDSGYGRPVNPSTGGEYIKSSYLITLSSQGCTKVPTDKTCSAKDEDVHGWAPFVCAC
jgi:hypothetical protein